MERALKSRCLLGKARISNLETCSNYYSNVGLDLLREHLFPGLSTGHIAQLRVPLLNTTTRQLIAETIFLLVKDDEKRYREILIFLSELVPYDAKVEDGAFLLYLPR